MSLYNLTVLDGQDNKVALSTYQGKVLLIVNTATKCGFTKQYTELQNLYQTFNSQGFEILDFPCNQFLGQAPGSNEAILSFCQTKFNITFKQFKKIKVNGKDADSLFTFLKERAPENKGKSIKWNFTKFLVDKEGNVIHRYEPNVKPSAIIDDLKFLLDK